LDRDWNLGELYSFVKNPCAYVHNHSLNWPREAIERYKENKWYFFGFIRDNPYDMLCSFYFFFKKRKTRLEASQAAPWGAINEHIADTKQFSLNRWLQKWSDQNVGEALPINIFKDLNYLDVFSPSNFQQFIEEIGIPTAPLATLNQSQNKGWSFYRHHGEISDATESKVEKGAFVAAHGEIMNYIKKTRNLR
jgi:hypothetical protein